MTAPGSAGRRYATKLLSESSYKDEFDDYLGFLAPRLEEIKRVLHPTGTLYLHLDYREAHYVKIFLDELFGRACFLNELIWAYDYGAKPKGRWPQKHDTILVYVKDPRAYYFDSEARGPRALHGARAGDAGEGGEGQAAGVGDVAHDRLPHRQGEDGLSDAEAGRTAAALRAGVARAQGDLCLDPFAGSGTLGAVARKLGRRYLLIDESPEAVRVMRERLG